MTWQQADGFKAHSGVRGGGGGAFPSLPMREGMEKPAESLGGSCGAKAQQGFRHDPWGRGSDPVGVGTGPHGRTPGEARPRLQSNRVPVCGSWLLICLPSDRSLLCLP